MVGFMIYHIRSKYTAVGMNEYAPFLPFPILSFIIFLPFLIGRKEMVIFFYQYLLILFLEMLLITGIIPVSSPAYQVRHF